MVNSTRVNQPFLIKHTMKFKLYKTRKQGWAAGYYIEKNLTSTGGRHLRSTIQNTFLGAVIWLIRNYFKARFDYNNHSSRLK